MSKENVAINYQRPILKVVSPEERVISPLSPLKEPVPYELRLYDGGGFSIIFKGENYPVESSYSFPYGGENKLLASDNPDKNGESSWQVEVKTVNSSNYKVIAKGKFYSVERLIQLFPNRVRVLDKIANLSPDDLGIIFSNYINIMGKKVDAIHLAGRRKFDPLAIQKDVRLSTNPTVFIGGKDLGLGLIALDDVYIIQSKGYILGSTGIYSENFALDKNSSYTLEWAVYLLDSGDYYDFINEVRKDEGRNGRVDGGLAFITKGPFDRRMIPTKEFIELRGTKYGIIHCLSGAADDPEVSIEGIEFMDFPLEMKLLKEQIEAIHKAHPGLKVMFHVAHSLYATNKPEEKFRDSRVIDAGGKHVVYPYDYSKYVYFSQKRVEEGWRWYIYYPTLNNSFGEALMKSVDVMMDDLGCDGVYMDGFFWGYGSEWTYDRWDGHSADIDPFTKTLVRKKGSVLLLSQDALISFVRKFRSKGGVVVANNAIVTRNMAREDIVFERESVGKVNYVCADVHLAPTVCSLADPYAITDEVSVYEDVYDKLRWGNLFIYYQEGEITHKSAPSQMFPITLQEIHSGYVKGTERLITSHSGIYGWTEDRDLHFCYLYDGRGAPTHHNFLTTVEASGVRTEVNLKDMEIAVIKKVPVYIETESPVNLILKEYDEKGISFALNGNGAIKITVRNGDFPIKPETTYLVKTSYSIEEVSSDEKGILSFPLALKGENEVKIEAKITVTS